MPVSLSAKANPIAATKTRRDAGKHRRADCLVASLHAKEATIEEGKMTNFRHKRRIQERAYQIWEQTGRPEGKSVEHWLQAEAEIAADEQELSEELKLEAEGVV